MRWHPVPFQRSEPPCPNPPCYADIFCSGHALLEDGRFLTAGGNINGTDAGGGLIELFSYSPRTQPFSGGVPDQESSPYGWALEGVMEVDRWYPTLTVLPDGHVLIASGASRDGRS